MTQTIQRTLSLVTMIGASLASHSTAGAATGDFALINEILASHTGADNTEYIELFGIPETSLDGLSLIVIESSNISSVGAIDERVDFGPTDQLGTNGFFLLGSASGLQNNYGVVPDMDLDPNLENDNLTVALVETTSIGGNSVSGSEVVLDAVALQDSDGGTFFFDAPVIGPDGSYFPAGARRVTDGVDTDTAADWAIGDFNLGPDNTPTPGNAPPPPPAATIMEIQGAGHLSPLAGVTVTTRGIVTAVAYNGFYVQDAQGDGADTTSDGIYVYEGGAAGVSVGDEVELTGAPTEHIPGGASSGNLSITQLSRPSTRVLSRAHPLPAPVVIGSGGRIAPAVDVITKEERPTNLQDDPGVFNPDHDGIDFFESLEGMLVTVESPVAVSAIRTYNSYSSELFTLTNHGAHVAPTDARTARGGIVLQPDPHNDGDQNPERVQIQLDGTLYPFPVPSIRVGDELGNVTGVVGYSYGNFEVNAVEEMAVVGSTIEPETTGLVGTRRSVTVASYNVLNHSAIDVDDNQRAVIASQIVTNLRSPDVIALQEIQDNNGSNSDNGLPNDATDGVVDASLTLQKLADAIADAGGPEYRFFDVAPAEGTSGGIPGGNIRNAFLYDPGRVKLLYYFSLTSDVLELFRASNPDAFNGTRNPLVAGFAFEGRKFTVINNHLSSRFGSSPIFGAVQPFEQGGEQEREDQCLALHEVARLFTWFNRKARVVVLGDLNTFEWTNDLSEILPGTGSERVLENLIGTIDDDNAYTYIFEGNSQALDHAFVTRSLSKRAEIDIVHVNVDFPRTDAAVGSDHDPLVMRFKLRGRRIY